MKKIGKMKDNIDSQMPLMLRKVTGIQVLMRSHRGRRAGAEQPLEGAGVLPEGLTSGEEHRGLGLRG